MTEDERCQRMDCIYRNQEERGVWAHGCDYLRITGRSRIKGLPDRLQLPCNCARYIPSETNPVEILTRDCKAEALALYRAGATDREIDHALEKPRGWACRWRHRVQPPLPVNRDRMGTGERYDWAAARRFYDEGACDQEIMELLGCSQTTVYNWREREGLPIHPAWDRRAIRKAKEKADSHTSVRAGSE